MEATATATLDRRTKSRETKSRLPTTSPVRRRPAAKRVLTAVPSWKRALDVSLVVMTLPISIMLIVAVALWIRLVSRGPALFLQKRVGHGEKLFTIFKFRTMHEGAPTRNHELHVARLVESDRPLIKLDELGDARLIPGACFLRSTGLDELPQLFNVLRGEMSLVGPRPCIPGEHGFFTSAQRERFQVLPGLTGLWQVNGKNRTTFREMAALDVAYARRSSLGLDLIVIFRTPMALLGEMKQCFQRRFLTSDAEPAEEPMLSYARQRFGDRS
ncbi:sugar transferase [Luteolibacter arcticus]|uniref:Sugar transferase n=1 Tax=Luteolibacter arcticus TaxID=1581411 RepID=A0ABT3GGZ4_9BACT|nr:sugar transferase [Luteolibacter arcticus]MCW1922887.1 sugar transferase [Luteolibacter arcticus]